MNSRSGRGINNGRRRVRKLLCYILIGCAIITLTLGNSISIEAGGARQTNKDAIVLETGKPIEREIKKGEIHRYLSNSQPESVSKSGSEPARYRRGDKSVWS